MCEAGEEKSKEKIYGDCVGPDAMYIKIIAADKHEFILKREHAVMSPTLADMLSGPGVFAENQINVISFKDMPSHVIPSVCRYLIYKARYTNSSTDIPVFPIDPMIAMELLMAAYFFSC